MNTFSRLCALAGALLLAACQYLVYIHAPVEAHMGVVQKIFYTHLPMAWWSFVSFFTVALAGAVYLKTGKAAWDRLAYAAAEVGVVLCTLALISGSIWARHSWGVWWTWDPRLSTALILWFLYSGYLMLRHVDMPERRRSRVCAVVGIIAFLDVPLVFFSARLWRSIHPSVFASEGGGLDSAMRLAAIGMVLAFGLLWWAMVCLARSIKDAEGTVQSLQRDEDD